MRQIETVRPLTDLLRLQNSSRPITTVTKSGGGRTIKNIAELANFWFVKYLMLKRIGVVELGDTDFHVLITSTIEWVKKVRSQFVQTIKENLEESFNQFSIVTICQEKKVIEEVTIWTSVSFVTKTHYPRAWPRLKTSPMSRKFVTSIVRKIQKIKFCIPFNLEAFKDYFWILWFRVSEFAIL